MILFYNIVYVYVCKICEEKFVGCWWSFSWLGQKDNMPIKSTSLRLSVEKLFSLLIFDGKA